MKLNQFKYQRIDLKSYIKELKVKKEGKPSQTIQVISDLVENTKVAAVSSLLGCVRNHCNFSLYKLIPVWAFFVLSLGVFFVFF